uniref:C3H1-type domain-containing protein n=1 Tax=Panagrellus redivivus TaxID=6233 RepID=A0A7E4V3Y3_PANRE
MRSVKTQGGDGEQPSNESTWCLHKTTCRNKDCPKRHPQMCKFDPKCTEETCTFWHPKRNLQGFKKIKNTKKTEEKK